MAGPAPGDTASQQTESQQTASQQAPSAGWQFAWQAWRKTVAALKVLLVTVGSVGAVVLASLIISIIQFQLRLSEARTQNSSITLESIHLITEYQGYIADKYKKMRESAEELDTLRDQYLTQYNVASDQATDFCKRLNGARAAECFDRFQDLLRSSTAEIGTLIDEYKAENAQSLEFNLVDKAAALNKLLTDRLIYDAQLRYTATQQKVTSACQALLQNVSERLGATTILGVSPELRLTVQVQCYSGDFAPTQPVVQPQVAAVPAALATDAGQGDGLSPTDPGRSDVRGVNRTLLSELVFYYKFYTWLTAYVGNEIILSPPEFIVILLVIATGILGSFLFHTYTMFLAEDHTKYPTFFAIFLRSTLSVMCALVIYILARTGFVAITEGPMRNDTVISPFVIAFMSVAAGLMAERAMERIRNVGMTTLADARSAVAPRRGRKTGADDVATVLAMIVLAGSLLLLQAPSSRAQGQVQPPRPATPSIQAAPTFGLRCQTPQFWCSLPQPGRTGTSCFCNTPRGSVAGAVVQ
jgi:hypothetical protein